MTGVSPQPNVNLAFSYKTFLYMDMEDLERAGSSGTTNSLNPLILFKRLLCFVLHLVSVVAQYALNWLSNWLRRSFSITLQMSSLVIMFLLAAAGVWAVVRYRFMTVYSRLPVDEADDETVEDLWLHDNDSVDDISEKSTYTSYFEEFVSAIKVLGYLDKRVFHELTRHMRTYRIDAGETISLEDLNGFSVVIDGVVQVFSKSSPESEQFQLMKEVKKASPISSFFTILELLTTEVKINDKIKLSSELLEVPPMDLNSTETPHKGETFAIANTSSTIAVIPAQAFRLLTRKYPTATADIIQVILMRWAQVMLNTSNEFLDFTDKIYEIERDINRSILPQLPHWLKEGAIQRLKELAEHEPEKKMVRLKPRKRVPNAPPHSSRGAHHVSLEHNVDKAYPGDLLSNVPLLSRHNSAVFYDQDLLSSITAKDLQSDESEDATLRQSIVEDMFHVVGFDAEMVDPIVDKTLEPDFIISAPNSPLLPQVGMTLNLNSKTSNKSQTEASSESPVKRLSYDEIIAHASKMVNIMLYREGEVLVAEKDRAPGILYVIDGTLRVEHDGRHLYDISSGVAGYLETVTSHPAQVSLIARSDVCVAWLLRKDFEKLTDVYPLIAMSAAKVLVRLIQKPISQLNFTLEWVHVKAGETLYRQGTEADGFYHVLSGRVATYDANSGRKKGTTEYGQGKTVAQLEALIEGKFVNTAVAVRETELVKVPRTLVEYLAQIDPRAPFNIAKIVAKQARERDPQDAFMKSVQEFTTVTVLPTSDGLPVEEFAVKLADAFRKNGRDIVTLTRNSILDYLGRYAFSRMGLLKLKAYLAFLEQEHETVIYVADTAVNSQWTKTCIENADCILLLANASSTPFFSDYERLIVRSKVMHRCHLILLHSDHYVRPGSTAAWLKRRSWVTAHHHIQMDFEAPIDPLKNVQPRKGLKKLREIKNKIQEELGERGLRRGGRPITKPLHNNYRFKNDFHRLARILSGEAIGLVLGGGGARGISHIGVLRAIEEMGIPIDMVGGTSIGSFVGGLYARDYDMVSLYGRAKKFANRMGSLWHMLMDLTYPCTSYTTGHEFNRGIFKAFGVSKIEDFWLQYFTNSTNITQSRMEIHQSGYAWRYIRASMSLAGLVPPLEDKGQMLLDGGYMDNLPVEEMRNLGAKHIIAVDVGSIDDTTPMDYGDSLSGLWAVFNRWNPFSTHPNVPNITEIQARLAYVSSVSALEQAKGAHNVVYLRPPIDLYATLDFGKFEEILSVGYTYAIRKFRDLEKSDERFIGGVKARGSGVPDLARRHSF